MINVAIVDDSAVVRQVLSSMLANQPDITLLGCARDPLFALKLFEQQWPDVIILDIEMPRMDGITFLKKVMAERPTPVGRARCGGGQRADGHQRRHVAHAGRHRAHG